MLSFKKKWLFVITTIFSFSFILFSQSPTPSVTLNLTLKHQEIIEGRSDFFLEDVIEQTLPSSFKGIKLGTIEDNTVKITSEELLDKLSSIKGYNIIISGNYVLVSKSAENDEEEQPQKSNNRLPLECLKEHLEHAGRKYKSARKPFK